MNTLEEIYARTSPMTLGELIDALKGLELPERLSEDEFLVAFDFGYRIPADMGSYRGYYDHVAIIAGLGQSYGVPVSKVLKMLEANVGCTMHGYKGGEYPITLDCPCWVVESDADAPDVGIVGVHHGGYKATICTRVFD